MKYGAFLVLLLGFTGPVNAGEVVDYDDLVERNGLYYKKFSDVPFTGEVTGQGQFKKG